MLREACAKLGEFSTRLWDPYDARTTRATYLNVYSRFLNNVAARRQFVGTWVCTLHSRLLRGAPSRGVYFVAELGYLADVEEPP